MTYTEPALAIEGITETVIINYFSSFNRGEFTRTASLFAETGELLAHFEKPIIGRDRIAAYLNQEARGMIVLPKQGTCEANHDSREYKVIGKVKNSLFSVNVAWYFTLNQENQITTAKISLLASPQELLGLKSKRDARESV
ncbi:MAG: nuclear transport factor 2 family protein [Cyanobacteria bacterium J06600_6]